MKLMQRDAFLERVKKAQHVLLGNGFPLSHPKFGEYFKWCKKTAIDNNVNDIFKFNSLGNCESDLAIIRKRILKNILIHYLNFINEIHEDFQLKSLFENYINPRTNPWHCRNFLENRENIFTLNHDIILYFEVLGLNNIADGFVTQNCSNSDTQRFLDQKDIIQNLIELKTRTRIYYLHGSWFIISNEMNQLRKLSFSKNSNDTIDSIFFADNRPDLILEDRSLVKRALIEHMSTYHNFCYEQLSKIKGELLIFGCSFDHDDHIFDKISQNKDLYLLVTYIDDINYSKIKQKLAAIEDRCEFIPIDKNVIWENRNDLSENYIF